MQFGLWKKIRAVCERSEQTNFFTPILDFGVEIVYEIEETAQKSMYFLIIVAVCAEIERKFVAFAV